MTRVVVSGAVLRWALERSGKSSTIQGRFPRLVDWLEGRNRPTLRQLEEFARATSTPLGYFFLPEPPDEQLPIPHFRTLGDRRESPPSPDLLETVQLMEQRQAWMRDYLIEQGQKPLPFVRSAKVDDPAHEVAQDIRQALGLTHRWATNHPSWTAALRELQGRCEAIGIMVVTNGVVGNNPHRKLDVNEFRGFVLVDDYAPLVFINGSDVKAAQMFTLSHELAHIWLGSSAAFDLRQLQPAPDETEQACNRIAAEFLVPEEEFRESWPRIRNEQERFQQIARQFKVSEVVAARRALDLGLIKRNEFLMFYNDYMQRQRSFENNNQEGGNFYILQDLRVGRLFGTAVVRAVMEGKMLYREAYRLTGLYGSTFSNYAKRLGFKEIS